MKLKSIVSALLALVMGLFTGCANQESDPANPAASQKNPVTLTALNVGKADCLVIQSADTVIMIDTGTEESVGDIERFLEKNNISRIDVLMLTHFDRDHVGGADKLIKRYDIGKVYATYYIAKESDDIDEYLKAVKKKQLEPIPVDQEMTFTLDGVKWQLFPPLKDNYKKEESNNSSMAARMCYGETSVLFTGDAQKARIDELLDIDGLQSDVIKMPHHGGYEKNLDDLLEAVQPTYAILTDSDDQPIASKTQALLEDYQVQSYSTRDGDIVIMTDGEHISVSQS
ncbi:MAG: MBL fold metallo-hydrolase [Clostridia bacterium]|nr:MBL fold metallo-hydrolase [Clostridia bacterium]